MPPPSGRPISRVLTLKRGARRVNRLGVAGVITPECPGRSATKRPRPDAAWPCVEESVLAGQRLTGRVRDVDELRGTAPAADRRRVACALSPLAARRRPPRHHPARARRL